jgi:hypothetical protein
MRTHKHFIALHPPCCDRYLYGPGFTEYDSLPSINLYEPLCIMLSQYMPSHYASKNLIARGLMLVWMIYAGYMYIGQMKSNNNNFNTSPQSRYSRGKIDGNFVSSELEFRSSRAAAHLLRFQDSD